MTVILWSSATNSKYMRQRPQWQTFKFTENEKKLYKAQKMKKKLESSCFLKEKEINKLNKEIEEVGKNIMN